MNAQLKSTFISNWKKYFQDAPLPIAAFFGDELIDVEPAKKFKNHHCFMADLMRVQKGQSLAFNAENIVCGGGKRFCGFAEEIRPGFEFFLSYGIPGKMEGERYKKDPETVLELTKNNPGFAAPAKWLIVKPFEKLETADEPEVIIFFASPDILSGLFTLANYDRADLYGVKAPFSAGCGSVIQYALLENNSEKPDCILGMFDSSARPYIKAELLSFAIPNKRFATLV
ncbi:MAG: DUF169 domain-containing protein, partial [Bacteroidota bacterium]|nr:DUF169 domain-containing protein [Bacteroidota bacterium]